MSTLLKYVGVFVILLGVAILAGTYYSGALSNTILAISIAMILLGYLGHIFLNKKVG